MIYLKMSSAYKPGGGYENILKIGYSKDKISSTRDKKYITENPTIKTLYQIKGGTQLDERNLHRYFKKYLKYGYEWFEYCDEILEFFRTHTTLDSIRTVFTYYCSKTETSKIIKLKRDRRFFLISVKNVLGFIDDRIIINFVSKHPGSSVRSFYYIDDFYFADESINWLSENYPELTPPIVQDYEDALDLYERNKELINKLNDDKLQFKERLKLLCETSELTNDEKKDIAKRISERFDISYNIVSPEKCKALDYRFDKIHKEFPGYVPKPKLKKPVITAPDKMFIEFCKHFKIGDRYSSIRAKSIIGDIFKKLNYDKHSKASYLSEFFEIKRTKLKDSYGRWISGLEILSVKDEYKAIQLKEVFLELNKSLIIGVEYSYDDLKDLLSRVFNYLNYRRDPNPDYLEEFYEIKKYCASIKKFSIDKYKPTLMYKILSIKEQ